MNKFQSKTISLLLVFCLMFVMVLPAFAETDGTDDYYGGYLLGEQTAEEGHTAIGWGLGGFAGGFLLGLIGGGSVVIISAVSDASPNARAIMTIKDKSTEFKMGFKEGYRSIAKKKNITSSCIGSGLGILTVVLLFAAASSN